ncbi:hypothetical protein [Arthrobacter mangrovi]|uniref:Uncharacterized protein n=1 Tax=Arthrobacter mangrovi TaxID=2966350 RepID=A0ABQ5MXQ1_9MICC|nr:hypothetical protein [Arthrobacter mangrovi]GLB68733.1 hypothetical protein AHIS1636_31750 [Arthrobacter mangrovi]
MTVISKPRNTLLGAAGVAALTLSLIQFGQAFESFGRADHIGLVLAFCGAAGTAAAVRLLITGCFESRLFTAILALSALLGQILRVTMGWPGDPATGWTVYGVLAAVLSSAVLVLVTLAGYRSFINPDAGTMC